MTTEMWIVLAVIATVVLVAKLVNWGYSTTREQKQIGRIATIVGLLVTAALCVGGLYTFANVIYKAAELQARRAAETRQGQQYEQQR